VRETAFFSCPLAHGLLIPETGGSAGSAFRRGINVMPCPFLEAVTMVYCRAYPVRKLIPSHMMTTASPCMGEGYRGCPFFQEHVTGPEPVLPKEAEAAKQEDGKEVG